ncbi:uncharacterized protein RHOBADRAFT_50773 [Rhodotorula graminis WP1]|uniref:RING-CH-type domain-containing protein n=1 Tax=Rhodotorula graminis (strain WP1) TaxID=578459 RepID=A0A194SFD5_RHOGW|nr:uncharacterized protein RHOBADRAFT_50773 [Rhodotorula graminis WP1]KPV78291.1 hypothetical protein RHOBADRAFT_50773 [Rhodotorula graminis WP1]
MADDTTSQLPVDLDSGMRRRNPLRAVADTEPTPTSSSSANPEAASWQLQLAEARRAMALKMAQQAQELDLVDPARAHASDDDAEPSRHDPEPSSHQRRTSVASSEGDDHVVEQLLRPTSAPTAVPVREDPAGEVGGGFAEEPKQEEGGERATEEQAPADDRICRICFGGAEDEEELGRLFSPCVCRGTSRHVHAKCLESWRRAAVSPKAFYECGQCKYQYQFRRTTFARALMSPLTVTFLTSLAFMALVFLSGFVANSLIAAVEARQSLTPSLLNDLFIPDYIVAGEGVREAVSFVEHRLEQSRWVAGRDLALQRAAQDDSSTYRFFNPSPSSRKAKGAASAPSTPPFLLTALLHAVKGSALLGVVSTFWAYAATTFASPLGRTLFRALRPTGGRRRAAERGASMSQLVLLLLILWGVVKSIRGVYRGVKYLTRVALSKVEDLVIEVN